MKILCFGDSNTYGFDPRSFLGSRYSHHWVDLLTEKLGCVTVNAGENGRTIPRREAEIRHFMQLLEQQKPIDLLCIMLGTNDLLQGTAVDEAVIRMESFLQRVDLGPSRILLIGPPIMQLGEWVPSQHLISKSKQLNAQYHALSEHLGIGFADTSQWDIPMTFDGVHFTEEGHMAFAEYLYNQLAKEIHNA